MKSLSTISFRELLAGSIADDPTIAAAAESLDAELQAVNAAIRNVLIYARIDELPEDVVDLLGWQFHVDFWEPAWPLDQKRAMVKLAIAAHRHKGTPWAVETVLSAFGISSRVVEWFEYDGDPYRFMLEVAQHAWGWIPEQDSLCRRVCEEMKSLRSHFDMLRVRFDLPGSAPVAFVPKQGQRQAVFLGCDPRLVGEPVSLAVVPVQASRQAVPVCDPEIHIGAGAVHSGVALAQWERASVPASH